VNGVWQRGPALLTTPTISSRTIQQGDYNSFTNFGEGTEVTPHRVRLERRSRPEAT
jgi:hypothetical protein